MNCKRKPFPCNYRDRAQCAHDSALGTDDPKVCFCVCHKLSAEEAGRIEEEMRQLERNPEVSKRALRLFMQHPMPCGHAAGNLLTCPDPPFGCLICGVIDGEAERFEKHLGYASQVVANWPEWKRNILGGNSA